MTPRKAIEEAAKLMIDRVSAAMKDFSEATGYDVEITGDSKMNTTTYNKSVRYKLSDGWK
jgi:hypothetical protein